LQNAYCISTESVNLIASPNGGIWTGLGVTDYVFYPQEAGLGIHTLSYSYTDEDGTGCSSTIEHTINVGEAITASIENLENVYCINDEDVALNLIPMGGTLNGNGIVNQSFYPSLAGEGQHTITYDFVSDGGCESNVSMTVLVASLTDVSFTGLEPTYCAGDDPIELIATPAGGSFVGTGINGNSFTPNEVGTTIITYTYGTGECISTSSSETMVIPSPEVNINAIPESSVCQGDSITLIASGGTNYLWSNGMSSNEITVTTGDNYEVVVSADLNDCSTTESIDLIFNEAIVPMLTQQGDTLSSSTASTHEWYLNGELLANATTNFIIPIVTGDYMVITTDKNGCIANSETFNFIVTNTNELDLEDMKIHPNPASHYLGIDFTTNSNFENLRISIVDAKGVTVLGKRYQQFSGRFDKKLNVSFIPNGIYALKITADDSSYVEKIVILR